MKRFYILCVVVISIAFSACAAENNDIPKVEPSVTIEPTKIADVTPTVALNEKTVTPVPTIVPTTVAPGAAAPEFVQEIKYKVEGNALVYYGQGILLKNIVDESIYELAENFQNIDKIIIEDGITQIDEYAFYKIAYSEIKTIDIAGSVKILGNMAFANCDNVETLNIEEGVEFIGSEAFLGCTRLKNVTIPQSVKVISRFAFLNTKWLEEEMQKEEVVTVNGIVIYVSNENNVIDISSNIAYASRSLLDESPWLNNQKNEKGMVIVGETLVACDNLSGDIVVPDGVKYIAEMAFSGCTGIQSVKIPQSVEFIGGFAFENCTGLVTVEMHDDVKYIAESAFEGCSSLRNIELPQNLQCLASYAFYKCTSLVEVSIPMSIKYLTGSTYYGCTNLERVEMHNELIGIGNYVFYSCEKLDKINIPENVEYIGGCAFHETKWFDAQLINNDVVLVNKKVLGAARDAEEIVIPNGAIEIVSGAFIDCEMALISIPDTIEKIGDYSFNSCSNLKSVRLPDNLKYFGDGMFYYCSDLVSIAIPKDVKILDPRMFRDCSKLTIYCDADSMAKQYAIENSLSYIEVDEHFWADGATMPVSVLSLQEKIEHGYGTIELEGELYNATWGENGAFIWRFSEATFDESAYYICCFITDDEDMDYGLTSFDQYYRTAWMRWRGYYDNFFPKHIGDNMFYLLVEIGYENAYYYVNPFSPISFTRDSLVSEEEDYISIDTNFNDGYAVCTYFDAYYKNAYGYEVKNISLTKNVVLLGKTGRIHQTEIKDTYVDRVGMYSDGVFYCNNAFYDIASNKILDLSGKNYGTVYTNRYGIYAPYFENGVCTLITQKNGKYWTFEIDKSGNMLTDAEEFDISIYEY